jgi:hypothetical protein
MEHSPSWEADSCSAVLKILSILWILMVHYCIYKFATEPYLE